MKFSIFLFLILCTMNGAVCFLGMYFNVVSIKIGTFCTLSPFIGFSFGYFGSMIFDKISCKMRG